MSKRTRILSILLCFVMVFSLCACGGGAVVLGGAAILIIVLIKRKKGA